VRASSHSSVVRPLLSSKTKPHFKTRKSLVRTKIRSWVPTGPQLSKDCVGEAQQKFTGLDFPHWKTSCPLPETDLGIAHDVKLRFLVKMTSGPQDATSNGPTYFLLRRYPNRLLNSSQSEEAIFRDRSTNKEQGRLRFRAGRYAH
jgi:hypothetical protein